MKAQVLGVEFGAKRGNYEGLNITYQGMPFDGRTKKPTTRFIFNNDPMYRYIQNEVTVDEWYDFEFKQAKNPKYTDLVSMSAIATPQDTQPTPQAKKESPMLPSNTEKSPYHVVASMNWNEKQTVYADLEAGRQANINRSVSLDHACKIVSAMVANSGYTAKAVKEKDFLAEEALTVAKKFYAYLSGEDKEEVDTSGVIEEPEFAQESM